MILGLNIFERKKPTKNAWTFFFNSKTYWGNTWASWLMIFQIKRRRNFARIYMYAYHDDWSKYIYIYFWYYVATDIIKIINSPMIILISSDNDSILRQRSWIARNFLKLIMIFLKKRTHIVVTRKVVVVTVSFFVNRCPGACWTQTFDRLNTSTVWIN